MKVSDILDRRRENWQQLEQLAARAERSWRQSMSSAELIRFAALYRAACADLALADAYQLPPNTVQYLHRLVGRAHNQLYRTRKFDWQSWRKTLLEEVPRRIFHDHCVQLMFVLFWGVFLTTMALGATDPNFTRNIIGEKMLTMLEEMHQSSPGSQAPLGNPAMASFYIQHNTTIGLQCFAGGLLIIPGIAVTIFNAAHLGAVFGYMAGPEASEGSSFFHFVTAHGPFELTAIVLSAGAGLRLGMAWLDTQVQPADRRVDREVDAENPPPAGPLSRESSLRQAAAKTMPVMGAAMVLFFLAALIEGFLSPSILPYWLKAAVAIVSTVLLVFYFIVLGFPKKSSQLTRHTMQLDRTRVVIRERGMLDICDLALRVTREFSPALLGMLALGIVPMALVNFWLIGWMAQDLAPSTFALYVWFMLLLVYIEAPLATVAATLYLGDAMFLEAPSLRSVLRTLGGLSGRLLVCQGLFRGVLPAWLLAFTLRPSEFLPAGFLLPILAFYLVILRGTRPYINEIIVLERNPLVSRDSRAITVGRRASRLHGPNSGELMGRYLAAAIVSLLLGLSVLLSLWFAQGIFLSDWVWTDAMLHVGLPAAMWIVAGYMCVVRFLAYLDLRTRREGWAVELQLRAEGARLARS